MAPAAWPDTEIAGPPVREIGAAIARVPRAWILALYLAAVVISTVQRGVLDPSHTTFPIFRQSYHHLVSGKDLYASYPAEQGTAARDLFKYSPTAALLFAPFAVPAFALGLLLWNLVNAAILVIAIDRLAPRRTANQILLLVFPAALSALQSSSSNALVAGLMVLAFVWIERRRQFAAATTIVVGVLFKLFPLAAVAFALPFPRRLRFAGAIAILSVAFVVAPLLVTPLHTLAMQYHSWWLLLRSDSADLQFGSSLMRVLRSLYRVDVPNWPIQLVATMALVAPFVAERQRWTDPQVRRLFLSSVLIYVVIFNHQAEHQSYAIASVGAALWYVTSRRNAWRTILMLLCVAGFDTVPYAVVWMTIQADLWRFRAGVPIRRGRFVRAEHYQLSGNQAPQ